jgi:hypothetical protein
MSTTLGRRRRKCTTAARLDAVTTFDPATGKLRHGHVDRRPFEVVLHLPKRLESPNRWLWTHWRTKHRVALAWGQVIRLAVLDTPHVDRATAVRVSPAAAVGWLAPPMQVRVDVLRRVRTAHALIKDRQNLDFASKALVDQVVKAGFLRDDSDAHIDLHSSQELSGDRLDWTRITITAPRPDRPTV